MAITSLGRAPLGRALELTVAAVLAASLLQAGPPPASSAAVRRPNLVITAVSSPPQGLAVGSTFRVRDTTKNTSPKASPATVTRYYLTTDPAKSLAARRASTTDPRTSPTDILLTGARKTPLLAGDEKSSSKAPGIEVQVPVGTPPATYFLLACADDRGRVTEQLEDDNCRASTSSRPVDAPMSGNGRVDAMSDTLLPLPAGLEQMVPTILAAGCAGTVPVDRQTLGEALRSIRSWLTATAGDDAVRAFEASAAYDSAAAAQEAAGGAALANQPGAALAAMLRAHELEPREASHLVNAGGIAASVGRPNEALAFLDAALSLDDPDSAPMGISRQAVALASRGYAELQLGQYSRAESALLSALAIDPLLTEAQATLAGARACLGKDPLAAFKKGRQRQDREPPIDDSLGQVTHLRDIQIPATARNAYSSWEFYRALLDENGAKHSQVADRIRALEARMGERRLQVLPAERQRMDSLQIMIYEAGQSPELLALRDRIDREVKDAEDAWMHIFNNENPLMLRWTHESVTECENDPDPSCYTREMRERCIPEVAQAHGAWTVAIDAAVADAERWMDVYSRSTSAIASNFKGTDGHELALREIEWEEIMLYDQIVSQVRTWGATLYFYTSDAGVPLCVQSPDPPGYSPPPPVLPQTSGPCPDGLKGLSFAMTLGPVSLSGNCEELTAGGGGEGWIAGFGEVTLNMRDGTLTVFAGAKGEVGLGPTTGDFKSGVYVKVGMDGPRDVGWRVGPSYTVGAGPAQFGASDTMDLSFVGGLGSLGL